jgi:hypothetical protein
MGSKTLASLAVLVGLLVPFLLFGDLYTLSIIDARRDKPLEITALVSPHTQTSPKLPVCQFTSLDGDINGEWIHLGTNCSLRGESMIDASWGPSSTWCNQPRISMDNGEPHLFNPPEYYQPSKCSIERLTPETVRTCMAPRRIMLVGDSTMAEIFSEFTLRLLGPKFRNQYQYTHHKVDRGGSSFYRQNSTDSQYSPQTIRGVLLERYPDKDPTHRPNCEPPVLPNPDTPACSVFPLKGARVAAVPSNDTLRLHYYAKNPVQRLIYKLHGHDGHAGGGGDSGQGAPRTAGGEMVYVRAWSPAMWKCCGGVGSIVHPPLSKIVNSFASVSDTVVINHILHSMTAKTKRTWAHFNNDTRKAEAYFNISLQKYTREFKRDVL